jgi:hypothetical protein
MYMGNAYGNYPDVQATETLMTRAAVLMISRRFWSDIPCHSLIAALRARFASNLNRRISAWGGTFCQRRGRPNLLRLVPLLRGNLRVLEVECFVPKPTRPDVVCNATLFRRAAGAERKTSHDNPKREV